MVAAAVQWAERIMKNVDVNGREPKSILKAERHEQCKRQVLASEPSARAASRFIVAAFCLGVLLVFGLADFRAG